MAHMIDMQTGRAGIAYIGEKPWHGLGTELDESARRDLPQWIIKAGLDWNAKRAMVQYVADDTGTPRFMRERSVLYRDDTKRALGVVADGYKVVQPREVINFYDELCSKYGFGMETAGSLRDGKVVWALAKTGEGFRLKGQDEVNSYLLLATSFDGSMATRAQFTSVRVVCNNTLQLARSTAADSAGLVVIKHSQDFNAATVQDDLGITAAFGDFQKSAEAMSEVTVTPQQQVAFLLDVYKSMTAEDVAKATDAVKKSADKVMERMAGILANAPGQQLRSAAGTVWGLVNAVTFDVDHSTRARSNDTRLSSAWFGAGATLKARAWEAAQKILQAA